MSPPDDGLYRRLFKAAPGSCLVLRPDSFEIVAVTDAYLQATLRREADLVGRTLFAVLADNPQELRADGVQNLTRSLARVRSLKAPDLLGVQCYPVRLPDGGFEERFWNTENRPVLDDDGEVAFILHCVEDVTGIVRDGTVATGPGDVMGGDINAAHDITLQGRALRQTLSRLQEYEGRVSTAEDLLDLGAWEFNVKTGRFGGSEQAFRIYDIPVDQMGVDFHAALERVHPDDREAARSVYADLANRNRPRIEFRHRVLTRDGDVRHVRGAGLRLQSPAGEVVIGYVQDISVFVGARQRLDQAERLLRLAGEKVRLGGWRVDLETETVFWTPETAAIHGLPAGYSPPDVSTAINFYLPEYRETIANVVASCVRDGSDFDVVCRLQAVDGRQPWVRAIGVPDRDQHGRIVAVQGAFQDITNLREAQAEAAEAHRQRLDILESITDAFFAVDRDWNFSYLNKQAEILLQRSIEGLLYKNIWGEFPEAAGSEFQRQYERAVERRITCKFEAFYPPLGKWFDVSAYPIPNGLAVYFRDVTGERARKEQLRLVEAALSRQNDIVIITEADPLDAPDGPRIVYVNDAFERLTGFSSGEALGQTPRLLQGPGTDRLQLDRIRQALRGRLPVRCELLNYGKSGQSYWLEVDITPLFDDEGQCTHFVAVERDITERKIQEEELREFQERFQLISRATNDVIWDWDLVSDDVWWNDAITRVFGHVISELEPGSSSWINRIHLDDRERVLESIHEVIEGDEEYWSSEYRFIMRDGTSAAVIDRGFVIRDENGRAVRMVGSMLDITERNQVERQLREAQKLEAVGHLTGGVAHDFNNLLTVIMGYAEMLSELLTDPSARSMAKMTLSAAERGAELTNRLLAFARRQPLDPKPTDINRQVAAMQALIRRTLWESIEIEFASEPGLGIAEIDPGGLDTALLNLVVNARDAMPEGGKLTIETANTLLDPDYAERHPEVSPGEYVMVCVSDTGVGMDPETVARAFEPFFTTKAEGKGSGLGLSMVFGFTKQSGGHIKIYSEPGEGTSVKLYFPRVQARQDPDVPPAAQGRPQGGTEHILIVEDNDLVLEHLKNQLETLGYRVTTAMSGPEAMDVLRAHGDIDLLLTDIVMPGGMNGRELADLARVHRPSLRVMFTSGYTENAIVHQGRLDPGVTLLSKPYTRLELATKVRAVLDRKV